MLTTPSLSFDMITHRNMMMKKTKFHLGRRLSQFLSKIFRHLNQQSTPKYSCFNSKYFSSETSTATKFYRKNSIDRYYIRDQYPAVYRTCSLRERRSTLSSIQEE